jgi:GNAT superfamily N-acetyltransferase
MLVVEEPVNSMSLYTRLIGPTGLSPHLGTGLLQDHWDELPPLHSPYDPPYMLEAVDSAMRPLGRSRLYHLEIPPERPPAPPALAQLSPLEPARLASDLLPLLAAACPSWADFAPPDAKEAAFLLRWLGRWPLYGWLAQVQGEPVGFVLLQPDLSPRLRRAGGGRRRLWRPWLTWVSQRPARQGRLLYGAVLPQWRGRGIGRQLLHQALITGHEGGWRTLSIGPLPTTSSACAFLERQGARSRQSYLLYQRDL